jgi:pyruvate formate lyase activating enzyme
MTVDEVFEILRKDEPFYRSSGGGVTIGGGEATSHPAFTLQLIKKCRQAYIHTALDTCGYVSSAEGIKALEEADLLLFDLKCMDPDVHCRLTGVSNELILNNIKRLDAMGKPIIIRVPLIPGCTDSENNLISIAEFLAHMRSIARVDLLPSHQYGKVKYKQLGRDYPLDIKPISLSRQMEIKGMFEQYGLNVQLGG